MRRFLMGFYYAGCGVVRTLREERNFQVQVGLGAVAVLLGFLLQLSLIEWGMVLGCCVLMLSMELMNTALEHLCDAVCAEENPHIMKAKDAAAGACLLVALLSAGVGAFIFLPKVFSF